MHHRQPRRQAEEQSPQHEQLAQTNPGERQSIAPRERVVRRVPVPALPVAMKLQVARVENFMGIARVPSLAPRPHRSM